MHKNGTNYPKATHHTTMHLRDEGKENKTCGKRQTKVVLVVHVPSQVKEF